MRTLFLIAAIGSGLSACTAPTPPSQGIAALHVPVVSSTNYVYDAAAPSGALDPGDAARLDGWFSGLGLDFGDTVYVASDAPPLARAQVAEIVGRYGMLLANGAPVAGGTYGPGTVRVVVSRRRASVPGCPDWSKPSQPNFNNEMMSNFGCGVNSNLAAQVANPEDLLRGRPGAAAEDAETAAKAIVMYRNWPLTGVVEGQQKRPFKNTIDTTKEK